MRTIVILARKLSIVLSTLLLCSCSTTTAPSNLTGVTKLPATVTMNKDAGRGGFLFVTIRLETGEKLLFIVDTGCAATTFDKSFEPKLGKCLSPVTIVQFGVSHESGLYEAPRLYLGGTLLQMTGPAIVTLDLKQLSSDTGRPIMGILGMDVLEHYCIQMDFNSRQMRFLDRDHVNKEAWGRPYSLTDIGDGCYSINENPAGTKGLGSIIDTGCDYDGWLSPAIFQQWTNQAQVTADGESRSPNGLLGGETYANIDLHGLDAKLFLSGDCHIKLNGIGLHFLSRNLVTFDFSNKTMYLKRTSLGPLIDEEKHKAAMKEGKAETKIVVKMLKNLKKKDQLPGWSKKDVGKKEAHFNFTPPGSLLFSIRKEGNSSVWHYDCFRDSKTSPWKLQKAWRADQDGQWLESYPIP